MMRGRALGLLAAAAAAPLARNVILFVPDELRAESMSLFGGPAPTPNYERLAAGGTAFSQAFSTYPVCTQSRSAFLTGRFTSSAGHRSLWNPLRYYEPNLLAYAKASGRHVFWAGKNDAMDLASFNASVSEAGEWGAPPSGANAFRLDEPEYYSFISNATTVPLNGTHDAACVARAIDFLRARAPDAPPFFIYLPLISPHPPYGCPAPFYGFDGPIPPLRAPGLPGRPDFHERIRFYRNATKWADGTLERVQRLYLGCIQYSDFVLGTLLDAVDELGLAGETAIVATVR
jgi:arylsulfatase A-like enzyme